MKYKLICVDIDGTLLDDEKKLLPQVKQSLKRAADMGIQIALVSGRMPKGVDYIEEELGISCIKVCNAGTYILLNNQCISAECLTLETMTRLYREVAQKNHIPLWIFEERNWYVTEMDQYIEREIKIIHSEPEVVEIESLTEQWRKKGIRPNKLLLAAAPEQIQTIYQEMEGQIWEEIDMACSAATLLEIFPKGINKGTALTAICDNMNINLEETIAFGDQELDIPMLEKAGFGIAMGNAIEEVKTKADFVTKTNNEAGIAYALEHFLMK